MAEKNIQALYQSLKSDAEQYHALWEKIARNTGITVKLDYYKNNKGNKSQALDQYIDDPTAALSVNQAGDYTVGIMWGTGEEAFELVPSRYVLETSTLEELQDYYKFATEQGLYHFNHENAGFILCLKPYMYDQYSFGNSGVGCWKNKGFEKRIDDNALSFQQYGVDNTLVDEGKSGMIEYEFATYQWNANRIVGDFAMADGTLDDMQFKKLPKCVQNAWNNNDTATEFKVVLVIYPREDFNPRLKGKRGTKFKGEWFLDEADNSVFFEEDYKFNPIAWARMIKVRGEKYGRSSGTMLISTINSVNFMVGETIEILEKLGKPSLGIWNNAIVGDSVLDTGSNTLNVFNPAYATGTQPIFPLYQVGDPTGIIQYLIPYLNEKVVTGFKVDTLLDFSSAKEMSATESLQRYAIRGKALSGILMQQKVEFLMPIIKRGMSILWEVGELGINPKLEPERAMSIKSLRPDRIIPNAVLNAVENGRAWFEIKLNNELEKLMRTEKVQALVQLIQVITATAALFPQIIGAVNWHKLISDINQYLDPNNQIIMSENEFKQMVEAQAQMARQQMQMAAGQGQADIANKLAQADKTQKEAQNV